MKIKVRNYLIIFLFIFLFFIPTLADVTEYDTNDDGKTDRWVYQQNGFVYKVELDVNFDGKIDAIFTYANSDKGPIPATEVYDTNYDGVMDDFLFYEAGKFVREEIDSNNDTKIDIWIYVADGYIYKIEKDLNFDGIVDEVINY